jgi:aminopeptidase YwaD
MPTEHLQKLCDEIGARPIGSPANQAAADYIQSVFAAAGLDVEIQPYPCTHWECSAAWLELDGQRLEAAANVFSLPCDVTAPVVPVCSIAELEAAAITGQIVLFYGDLARYPLAPKSWFLKNERDEKIIQLLETKQPAALLAPPTPTLEYEQVTEDWEIDLPAATISPATALKLLTPGTVARLRIESRRIPATARNIVARKAGKSPEKVVLMAHFDTKIGTPGASDNGASVAALLELARSLGQSDLPFGLEFVAFNGEEYLPMGDDEYLRRGESEFGHILAAINMDGAGTALGTTSITSFCVSPEFRQQVEGLVERHPGVVWVDPWPESNHSTFAFRGIPSLAFGAVGTRALAHSPADTSDQVSPAKLAEMVELVTEIVHSLQGKTPQWSREASTNGEA